MRRCLFAICAAGLLATGALRPGPSTAADAPPHVLLIVEENRSAAEVLGTGAAPYLTSLADSYGVAANAFGQSHPSLPNYLELLSGSTQGVSDDGTAYSFAGPTLVKELHDAGIGWRAYMEDLPSPCSTVASAGGHVKKHDPFMYFARITADPALCAQVVPFTQFASDIAGGSAPPFLWVTPNLCDDGHDCSTATMDAWLHNVLPAVLQSSWFAQHGVVIITWDEGTTSSGCCGGAHGGQIATVVIAHDVMQHRISVAAVDHAGTLRSIEALFGVPYLGDSACACSGDLLSLVTPPAWTWLTVPRLR